MRPGHSLDRGGRVKHWRLKCPESRLGFSEFLARWSFLARRLGCGGNVASHGGEHDGGGDEAQPERAAHPERGQNGVRTEQRGGAGAREVDCVGPRPATPVRLVVAIDDVRDEREGGAHQRGGGQDQNAPEREAREELSNRAGELSLQRGEDLERAMEPEGEADARHADEELERPVRPERTSDRTPREQRARQRAAGGESQEVGEDHHRGARRRRAGQKGDVLFETLFGEQPREAGQPVEHKGPTARGTPLPAGPRLSNVHAVTLQKAPPSARRATDRLASATGAPARSVRAAGRRARRSGSAGRGRRCSTRGGG